jgi:hypothetical protein
MEVQYQRARVQAMIQSRSSTRPMLRLSMIRAAIAPVPPAAASRMQLELERLRSEDLALRASIREKTCSAYFARLPGSPPIF